jgi:large repetitive protein
MTESLKTIMKKFLQSAILGGSFVGLALVAQAQVTVPGSSDPWLAGQPSSTTASSGDVAPAQSPAYAGTVVAGTTITWTATGTVNYIPTPPVDGPNGNFGIVLDDPSQNGIAGLDDVPVDALVGVFLGPAVPTNPAPTTLDFTGAYTYSGLTPGVDQPFYMGDGSDQSVVVPTGGTRLFLGTVDGFGWYNNVGAFNVTLTNVTSPVPDGASTMALLGAAFGMMGFVRRKMR